MTQVSEITEQRHSSQEFPKQSRLGTGLKLVKMLPKNLGRLKKVMVLNPAEPRYVRPPREYKLPPFRESMRYCASNEKYLKPTRWCNPCEPEVIAMANELGAYDLSDYEFSDAAYWFVKTKLTAEMLPLDGVSATLKRGTGTCYHLISVWIALCRAAGIKARYKTFKMMLPDEFMRQAMTERSEMMAGQMTANMFNTGGTPEGEGEVCIDGKWVVGHVAMRPEILAGGGLPIPKFGEDAIGMTFKLVPGTIERFESIPLKLGIAVKALMSVAPAAMERANVIIQREITMGKKVIEEAGDLETYDRKAREKFKRSSQTVEVEDNEALVFEE
ncbi:MAG TPA: transglutaminase family protein [Candidatus Bathyarchaeia archaeon]|nr:transglutaminase family protein [Candidatus Bathyarchaeia archaeon]